MTPVKLFLECSGRMESKKIYFINCNFFKKKNLKSGFYRSAIILYFEKILTYESIEHFSYYQQNS